MTAGVLVAFLQAGRVVDHASSLLLLPATALLLLGPVGGAAPLLLAATLVFALAEKYYAWRVALDAGLFTVLLHHPDQSQQFDAALADMLGRPAPLASRSMHGRWQGARRLWRRQALCLGAQLLATAALFLAQIAKMTPLA